MPSQQAKNWCFTLNNYTNDELDQLMGLPESTPELQYLVFGRETGESGTPHLQGFVSFNKRFSLGNVKRLISSRVHLEPMRGTPEQAAEYCKKDRDFEEFGSLPKGRGHRTDLEQMHCSIVEGATIAEIRESFFSQYMRYHKAIDKYAASLIKPRTWETETIVYWGRTGTGKTRKVFDSHDIDDIYVHTGERWFDGYRGQPVVLFDDFNGSEFTLTYLLRLLDRYPMTVPVKGDFVQWVPKTIYITSNKDPNCEWYPSCSDRHKEAMFRRIKEIQHFTDKE